MRAPSSGVTEVRSASSANDPLTTSRRTPASDASTTTTASAEDIQRATEDLQQRVKALAPELQFSIDQTSGRSIIKFTDRATNEVIRQFPTEEALALTRAMDQFQRGLIFNRKA
jgi:flagellar protein FlaG